MALHSPAHGRGPAHKSRPARFRWWSVLGSALLAAVALCVATTILLKMHGAKYMWITCGPLAWLVIEGVKGHFQAETHVTLLREVRASLPGGARVIL